MFGLEIPIYIKAIAWLVTITIAWLSKSPLWKRVPGALQELLIKVDATDLYDFGMSISTKSGRRDLILQEIIEFAAKHEVTLDKKTAGQVLDLLTKLYRDGRLAIISTWSKRVGKTN